MLGVLGVAGSPALASSHREAPLISQDPVADNTDVYMFKDPVDQTKVDIVANYIGLEDPAGGPNFARFGDDVLYEIHINNTGNATDQITYQFRFQTTVKNPNTFLYNTGPVGSLNDPNLNVVQTYSVRKIDSTGSHIVASNAIVAPANVGRRSTPNYDANLGLPAVAGTSDGGQVFTGIRKDPFFVDLGSVFDLLGLRPLNQAHKIPLPTAPGIDALEQKNVHEIALRLPIASVTKNHNIPTTVDDPASVIGVYASSSRQRVRVLSTVGGAPRNAGQWIQVSRLGLPLVNEVLIPLGQKDRFNSRTPAHDTDPDGFAQYILNPEPARLIPVLYPGVKTPPPPRTMDILPILQGAGAGLSAKNYLPPADLLRVNLAVPVNPNPNRLGILANDNQGFPDGRRLTDDVVDIELRLIAGGTPFTPQYNMSPNNALTDGVDASSLPPIGQFPYEATPIGGYDQRPATSQPNP